MSVEQAKSLIQAAERGELKKVEHCLKTLSINATDDQSQTALHFAAANGHERVVRHLIKKGAALECENWSGWTPIMYAAYYGHLNIVTLLVHNKANVNALNKRLATPLTCAARCGHQSVLEFLLENGATCDPVIQVGDVMQTVFVTPLMAAAQHGHIQIVSLLVQYQANVDYQNPDTGYTALMLAAINDHLDIVELLISTGCANPNITNCRNQTALQLSAQCKVREVEMFLLEKTKKRVRILSNSYNIQNDLIEVSKGKSVEAVKQLLNANPKLDVNTSDDNGATPLIYACIFGQLSIVRELLKYGAKPDLQDLLNGWTALMQATLKRHADIVKELLLYKANISIKNNQGLTVFDLATLVGDPQITRLLCPKTGFDDSSDERDGKKGMKTFFSKVGGKMGIKSRNTQTFTRVQVQSCDLVNGSSVGDNEEEESDELKKTSSVLSVLDAGTHSFARAKITLVSPQQKLPDDVVAPVLPPYSKLPSFDLPKMPIMGTKLSSSNGSGEISPCNSSSDSTSLRQQKDIDQSRGGHMTRPRRSSSSSFKTHHEPDSPQSSMTSSGLTSISRFHGPAVMPSSLFQKSPLQQPFSKPSNMTGWGSNNGPPTTGWGSNNGPPTINNQQNRINYNSTNLTNGNSSTVKNNRLKHSAFPHQPTFPQQQNMPSLRKDLPRFPASPQNKDDIEELLRRLSLEKYRTAFEEEEVDMEALKEMNDKDLKSLAIDQTIDRERILNAVGGGMLEMNAKHKARSLHSLNVLANPSSTPMSPSSRAGSAVSAPGYFKLAPIDVHRPSSSGSSSSTLSQR